MHVDVSEKNNGHHTDSHHDENSVIDNDDANDTNVNVHASGNANMNAPPSVCAMRNANVCMCSCVKIHVCTCVVYSITRASDGVMGGISKMLFDHCVGVAWCSDTNEAALA